MKFVNKLMGMGRDGFCQAISLHLQLIIPLQSSPARADYMRVEVVISSRLSIDLPTKQKHEDELLVSLDTAVTAVRSITNYCISIMFKKEGFYI